MILADTSIWVDHLRTADVGLVSLLGAGRVLMHPFVVGEIALGRLRQRAIILGDLLALPQMSVATDSEVMEFIEQNGLSGTGIGWVDAHLLAAVRLTAGAQLWTRDKRLNDAARHLRAAFSPPALRRSGGEPT